MKRVLIITYYWPPGSGAGVHRWLKFVKYLRDFGWEPIVYTPENPENPATDYTLAEEIPEGIEVIRRRIWEPYAAYKKFVGRKKNDRIKTGFLSEHDTPTVTEKISVWIRGNLFIPDARRFWIRPSVRFLSKYLKKKPVDAIVSTGPPHSMHLIALVLKNKTGIPWLADFRDPWTNIDYYHDLKLTKKSDARHRQMEKEVLLSADRVVVVSNGMAKEFDQIQPRSYQVITNGFDRKAEPMNPGPGSRFSLVHIGSLAPSRNPESLWKAISQMVSAVEGFKDDLEIRLVGQIDRSVKNMITQYDLDQHTRYESFLSHTDALKAQQQAQVLLLIINNTPNASLITPGKMYEYLQAGRPILSIGPHGGDTAHIIAETKSGQHIGFSDTSEIKNTLLEYYRQYKQGTLQVHPENIERFSSRSLTGKMAAELDAMFG
ncbi:MAG: glycosyltransferase family 4 protein [Bacteroidales bacterium]